MTNYEPNHVINTILEYLGSAVSDNEVSSFRKLLAHASEKRRHIRIIGVGEERVGKTTLCKRLLQRSRQEIDTIVKTEGIETHMYAATISDTGKVTVNDMTGNFTKKDTKQSGCFCI